MISNPPRALQKKVVLITGASSGIGAAIAQRLSMEDMTLVLAARREDRLNDVAEQAAGNGATTLVIPVDLRLAEERIRLMQEVEERFGRLDILINNAGFGWYGFYAEMPWETAADMLWVNVAAAAHLTRLALPGMLERGQGHILMIGSVAGDIPSQGVAMYSATKAFLNSFTTSLRRECAGSGVHVSNIKPGPVSTEFFPKVRQARGSSRIPAEWLAVPSSRVAQAVWRTMRRPRRLVYVPGILGITPWIELLFGWLMDRVGPLLLRRMRQSGNAVGSVAGVTEAGG